MMAHSDEDDEVIYSDEEMKKFNTYVKTYCTEKVPFVKIEGEKKWGECGLCVTSKNAKHFFFLKPAHLKDIEQTPVERCWGGGQPRYYDMQKVLNHALIHNGGKRKFIQKIEARRLREEKKKRKREDALKRMNTVDLTAEKENTKKAKVSTADLKKLQKSCARQVVKELITWDFMRKKNYSCVGKGTTRMDRITPDQFCALAGIKELDVLEKRGAWYTASKVSTEKVFGSKILRGKGGRFQCNRQLGLDDETSVTLKYAPSSESMSITVYVRHNY